MLSSLFGARDTNINCTRPFPYRAYSLSRETQNRK